MQSPFKTLVGSLDISAILKLFGIQINMADVKKQAEAFVADVTTQAQQLTAQLNRIEHKLDALCAERNIKVDYERNSSGDSCGSITVPRNGNR